MFSFDNPNPQILERGVNYNDIEATYNDKYVIAINARHIDSATYGDIIAILTPEEYRNLGKPNKSYPTYTVMQGYKLMLGGLGIYATHA
jgi:hypothetical protein